MAGLPVLDRPQRKFRFFAQISDIAEMRSVSRSARAMIHVAETGPSKQILSSADINQLSA
jgi:hypothetical protein